MRFDRFGMLSNPLLATTNGKDDLTDVGVRKQLFVDDYVVAEQSGVKQELQSAKKENDGQPIRFWTVNADGQRVPLKAWIYASPYYDDERRVFRMWSRVYPDGKNMRLGYSESTNGVDSMKSSRREPADDAAVSSIRMEPSRPWFRSLTELGRPTVPPWPAQPTALRGPLTTKGIP